MPHFLLLSVMAHRTSVGWFLAGLWSMSTACSMINARGTGTLNDG